MSDPATTGRLNEFYGNPEQLRRYLQRYLPYIKAAPSGHPVLDLGCGSGAFIELLQENGLSAVGIDLADEAVSECTAKGLNVFRDDALHFLSDKHEEYGSIFCSHLIEHFEYDDAVRLLVSIHEALVTGGRIVLITPNPASLEVSEYFWLDPTHVRPYPLPLLVSMLEQTGFQVLDQGQQTASGLPRRGMPRRFLLKLVLGRHYGKVDSYIVGKKKSRLSP